MKETGTQGQAEREWFRTVGWLVGWLVSLFIFSEEEEVGV